MPSRTLLAVEFTLLFLLGPVGMYFFAETRAIIYAMLLITTLYALVQSWRTPGFSWSELWHGEGWEPTERKRAFLLFLLCAAVLTALTVLTVPDRLFALPRQRPVVWVLVMLLYPILSVLPQELIFRSFFMTRYQSLFPSRSLLVIMSGLCFGLSHLILNNWIAPAFTTLGGLIFAYGFSRHRSLKWASIEHALYGCFVFTIGLGVFFFTGYARP
jgi:membrane protease YdiL (CAAX protease family)